MRADAPQRQQGLDHPGLGLRPRAGPRDGRSARACWTPPAPATSSPRRRWTTCTRRPSCCNSPKGVLHLVNNYTGDRLAFEMGRELAEAEGIKVETLIVNDDVAVKDSTYTVGPPRRGRQLLRHQGGRRGRREGRRPRRAAAARRARSTPSPGPMGIALTSCTPPAKGSPLFDIADDEMEVGVGIHGEPGRRRDKLGHRQRDRRRAARGGRARPALQRRRRRRADDQRPRRHADQRALPALRARPRAARASAASTIRRNYVGEYCTSLDMAGASITLVRLDDEIAGLLAAPAEIAIRTF